MITDSIAPTTTQEENLHAAGQRQINRVWEYTQALIAVAVTIATLAAAFYTIESTVLSNAFFLVVGFYFGRTNHTRVGGIGGESAGSR